MFNKILIANRGEIAIRIIRACREMGIKTVAVYSEADKKSLHVRLADEAYCIGKAPSKESYLNQNEIIRVALMCGAEGIHPGYGFLSENASFAEKCCNAGIVFIGPPPDAIRKMGDKAAARKTMIEAGVPVPKGTTEPISCSNKKELFKIAKKIGYPLLIKPAAGGGGKGMRIVYSEDELLPAINTSQQEANAAFGSDEIYIEKFINNARHIEFQIIADNYGNVVHVGERECSVQRRHQKLIEESPSPALDEKLRKKMGNISIRAAKAVKYRSVGTIEYLLTEDKKFYFIEMNTRLQVEHPVTECVSGIDLVKTQIRIAAGEPLHLKQSQIKLRGHAIECRINAEDSENNFLPSPGKIKNVIFPGGPGIRIDTHIHNEYEIPHYYDSLIAKLITYGENRETAIERMKRALEEFSVEGIKTTIPLLKRIMDYPKFRKGSYCTNILENIKKEEDYHKLKGILHKIRENFHCLWPEE